MAPHGRMTKVIAFSLPITDTAINQLLESEADMAMAFEPLPMSAVDPLIAETIQTELDAPYALYSSDVGRGASGYGVVLEVIGFIADVGGAAATLVAGIELTRRLYNKLKERLGYRPLISLGTASFLAAADLSERFSNTDFRFHGAGDTRDQSPDGSYTGNDCFYVIFERGPELFFYVVDARGKVKFLGNVQMPQLYEPYSEDTSL